MNQPAIVAVAYNRPDALKRLLLSIESAEYGDGVQPVLVISIDKSDSGDVLAVADDFEYTHGKKIVMARPERMGLREHVLSCGDLTGEYGSIIVLEDDLFVSPRFYSYACAALDHSEKDERIGAVSLYDHRFNVHAREPFGAIDDGYDNYYLQIASSWGQAYTKKQWESFRAWYDDNKDRDLKSPMVPENISGWSDRSWLKYYIVYLIETQKYCLYPRVSLTTNFGDEGTHAKKADTDLQVPVAGKGLKADYRFSSIDESRAVYDPFFEALGVVSDGNARLGGYDTGIEGNDTEPLIVDLYGIKPAAAIAKASKIRYVLTPASLPYKVIKSFGRQMRPVDANIVYNISGNDLHLYDMSIKADPPAAVPKAHRLLYDYRGISAARMIEIIKYRILEKLGRS